MKPAKNRNLPGIRSVFRLVSVGHLGDQFVDLGYLCSFRVHQDSLGFDLSEDGTIENE